ncbi:hypothetical protein Hanom_Chr04g00366461 [Helianthus anomalus]
MQPILGLYTKWIISPTRLVFWVEFSHLVCNIGIRARTRSGGLESRPTWTLALKEGRLYTKWAQSQRILTQVLKEVRWIAHMV